MASRTKFLLRAGVLGLVFVLCLAIAGPQTASAVSLPVIDGSLKLWLDAGSITGLNNGDPVGTWTDRSGNGNSAAQANLANQPSYVISGINGLPTVRFDGNDFIGTTASFGNPYSIFTISRMEGTQNFRLITSGAGRNWLLGYWGGDADRMYAEGWVLQGTVAPGTGTQMYAATGTGSLTSFYNNGRLLASNAGGIQNIANLQLGGWGATGSEASKGDVSEVLIYNRVLSAAEQQQVFQYLAEKYSVTNYSNLAYARPIIAGSSAYNGAPFNSGQYAAFHVVDGTNTDAVAPNAGSSYWLGSDGNPNEYFTLDLGASQLVQTISLRNTHNQAANDRGTRTFELWASNSVDGSNQLVNPVKILAGTLSTTRGPNNDAMIPLDVFNEYNGLKVGSYRYLRFNTLTPTFNNNNVGLNEIQVFSDSRSANVAAGKPVTASGYLTGYADFVPQNVVDQRLDDLRVGFSYDNSVNAPRASYWLGREGTPNEWIVVDLGAQMAIDRIDLQNTHNTIFDDSGTRNFRIDASGDGLNFATIFSGTLPSAFGTGDNIPIQSYSVANGDFGLFAARYVRFWATDYYGVRAGLNEIFVFAQVPEPSTLALACLGLVGLAASGRGLRRPRKRT